MSLLKFSPVFDTSLSLSVDAQFDVIRLQYIFCNLFGIGTETVTCCIEGHSLVDSESFGSVFTSTLTLGLGSDEDFDGDVDEEPGEAGGVAKGFCLIRIASFLILTTFSVLTSFATSASLVVLTSPQSLLPLTVRSWLSLDVT